MNLSCARPGNAMSRADYQSTNSENDVGRIDGSAAGLPEPAARYFSGPFLAPTDRRHGHRRAQGPRGELRVAGLPNRLADEGVVLDGRRDGLTLDEEPYGVDVVELG